MNIIHEIIEKIIRDYQKNQEALFKDHNDLSRFIEETKHSLDEAGVLMVKETLETSSDIIKASPARKKEWYVQRKADEKTLLTQFGAVHYKRAYYKHKTNGSYSYLSDTCLGIDKYERMDVGLKAHLIEQASMMSYEKSATSVEQSVNVSRQSVLPSPFKKWQRPFIYIEADEDHVALQNGKNKQTKLIYVHEGREKQSKGRYKLKNIRYFTGAYKSTETLWLEVATYLDEHYDLSACDTIFLSGDGAAFIKEGLSWIEGSVYVLDYFHLSKAVTKAAAHMQVMVGVAQEAILAMYYLND